MTGIRPKVGRALASGGATVFAIVPEGHLKIAQRFSAGYSFTSCLKSRRDGRTHIALPSDDELTQSRSINPPGHGHCPLSPFKVLKVIKGIIPKSTVDLGWLRWWWPSARTLRQATPTFANLRQHPPRGEGHIYPYRQIGTWRLVASKPWRRRVPHRKAKQGMQGESRFANRFGPTKKLTMHTQLTLDSDCAVSQRLCFSAVKSLSKTRANRVKTGQNRLKNEAKLVAPDAEILLLVGGQNGAWRGCQGNVQVWASDVGGCLQNAVIPIELKLMGTGILQRQCEGR